MSFDATQAKSFLHLLAGKTSTFLIKERGANLAFARTTMALAARAGHNCAILDLDALYSSNFARIVDRLPASYAESTAIQIPDPESSVEEELARVISTDMGVIVVDSLNTLYHILSQADSSSRSRKLAFAIASLSYIARASGKIVMLSMYRREGFGRPGAVRSISGLSDTTTSVDMHGSELTFTRVRGSAWPENGFSIRIP
jgi:hypothetical protein